MGNSKQQIVVLFLVLIFLGFAQSACNAASDEEIEMRWKSSAHANAEAQAFTRWNNEDPAEIPANCAKCHSTHGYLDYLGEDGSTAGQVDHPAPVGTTIECEACHNDAAEAKHSVSMPSTIVIESLSQEANCMACHQGRASSAQVNEAVSGLPADQVQADLRLPNIHNNAAGPTVYGTEAKGGGEYANQSYREKFDHQSDTCITCHDPHTLQVNIQNCGACHLGATTIEGMRNIRLSKTDFDGDGDISEGLSGEIETMQEKLLVALKLYTATTEGAELIDFNGRFVNSAGDNYNTCTPRLLQAAYNYQYADKDSGSYSHHSYYIMQLLYDSIEDLGGNTRGMIRPLAE